MFVMCTFFLCSFCRSLNCSILLTSSFSNPESWMCKFPTFSISEKCRNTQLKAQLRHFYKVNKKDNAGNTSCAYVFSFHQKTFLKSCENKMNTGQVYAFRCFLDIKFCWINVLLGKVDSKINISAHMHSPTYQISYNPPALRAIVTSSLPYFSSADALSGKNPNRAEPHCN